MRKFALIFLLAMPALSGHANAEANRPYIEFNANYLQNLENKSTGAVNPNNAADNTPKVTFEPMTGLGGEIGIKNIQDSGFRLAATAEFATINPKTLKFSGTGGSSSVNVSGTAKDDAAVYKFKGYYDFELSKSAELFLGAALGVIDNNGDTDPATAAILGVNFKLNEHIYFGVKGEYAYLFTGKNRGGVSSEDVQTLIVGINLGYVF